MEPQSSYGCASADARAASIKLVFKKAMLSKLGHSAASTTRPLDDGEAAEPAAATPKTAEKKSEKKASSAAKRPQKAQSAPAKASPSKAAPAKSSSKAAPSKAAAAAKKVTPQKQKRSDSNIDAASITTDLGVSVISSTEGLDLADAAGDALPMGRVKRTMRELVGDLKLSNESVAAIVVACHGFISYMTTQAALASPNAQLHYDHLAALVRDREMFEFLDEVVPQRVTAEDAAAFNAQLKLANGVTINPEKKRRIES